MALHAYIPAWKKIKQKEKRKNLIILLQAWVIVKCSQCKQNWIQLNLLFILIENVSKKRWKKKHLLLSHEFKQRTIDLPHRMASFKFWAHTKYYFWLNIHVYFSETIVDKANREHIFFFFLFIHLVEFIYIEYWTLKYKLKNSIRVRT